MGTEHIIVAALAVLIIAAAILWRRPARAATPPATAPEPEPTYPRIAGQAFESYRLEFQGREVVAIRDPAGPLRRADGLVECGYCHSGAPNCVHVQALDQALRNVEAERNARAAEARKGRR